MTTFNRAIFSIMAITMSACGQVKDQPPEPKDPPEQEVVAMPVGTTTQPPVGVGAVSAGDVTFKLPKNTLEVNGGTIPDLTLLALGSLPTIQVAGEANGSALRLNSNYVDPASEIGLPVFDSRIRGLFRLECYWPNSPDANYCPPAIRAQISDGTLPPTLADGGKGPYVFSNGSLIGTIHHSKSYLSGAYQYLDESTSIDPGKIEFEARYNVDDELVDQTAGEGQKFIIPMGLMYNRFRKDETYGTQWAFHDAESGKVFSSAALPGLVDSNKGNNGVMQSHVTLNDTYEARIHAFNHAKTYGERTILLVNFQSGRFMLKRQVRNDKVVVVGQGGFDFGSFSWKEGSYYARAQKEGNGVWEGCVDNQTQVVLGKTTAAAACADVADFFGTAGFDAAAYLDMNAAEIADLSGYLAFFENPDFLTAEQVPAQDHQSFLQIPDHIDIVALGSSNSSEESGDEITGKEDEHKDPESLDAFLVDCISFLETQIDAATGELTDASAAEEQCVAMWTKKKMKKED